MQQYIHTHLSYDQVIGQQLPNSSSQKQDSGIVIKPKKDKPFWIQKNKKYSQPITNLTQSAKDIINSHNPENSSRKQQQQLPAQLPSRTHTIIYNSDFQVYQQQQFYESIAKDFPIQKAENPSFQFQPTQRKNNHSAILPNIRKQSVKKPESTNRHTQMLKQSVRINKSTIQLRQQNKKLIKSIENYRKIIPTYKKNIILINSQRQQLSKMKYLQMKCYDVDYEYSLDKNAQKSAASIADTQSKIKLTENGMRLRNNYKKWGTKGLVMSRISRVQQCGQQQKVQLGQYLKLRQQILYRKKQQELHSNKLLQLNQKIAHYQKLLIQLQQRAKIGLYQQFKRKKIVIEYDIQMKKGEIQQKQCQLMLQISELNNKSSKIQVQILKTNAQILHLNMMNQTQEKEQESKKRSKSKDTGAIFNNLQQKRSQKGGSQNSITTTTTNKPVSRILRLFGRKK